MYTHWHNTPRHLRHVRIENNRIDQLGNDDPTRGVFYRRVNEAGSSSGSFCTPTGGEDDIFVVGNSFINGGNVDVRCAQGPEVCVQGNIGADQNFLVSGVRTSGCVVAAAWDQLLAGIHRGDFNGDGQEDFVQSVGDDAGSWHWRAHLSAGDGFIDRDSGDGVTLLTDTEKYGVHVADYNGDGCDDIAFRARCGTDNHSCWQVLASQATGTFAAQDWGDGKYWDPAQTEVYGLLVGDFDGNGRDDIAYRGRCGSARPCLRVHRSTTSDTFTAGDWGDGLVADGSVTAHFGMRVGDHNGDGRADIAYRGRCGGSGVPQWRYHLGAASPPFTISCSTVFEL